MTETLTYNIQTDFRYLCGRLVEVHPALVAADVRGEDVVQGEVGGLLLVLEEGAARHHVDVRPVPGLGHLLVPAVISETRCYMKSLYNIYLYYNV